MDMSFSDVMPMDGVSSEEGEAIIKHLENCRYKILCMNLNQEEEAIIKESFSKILKIVNSEPDVRVDIDVDVNAN